MTIMRTIADLTRHDLRRIKRGRYEILAVETRPLEGSEMSEILWSRQDPATAIQEDELPFWQIIKGRVREDPASPSVTSAIDRSQQLAGEFVMSYQIIDAVMARSLQQDAARTHPLFAWIILQDLPDYPGVLVARLVTDAPTPYVLLGHTLAELHASLPPGLERSTRRPADQPEVVEVWFPR
jgi:hypothetical protein